MFSRSTFSRFAFAFSRSEACGLRFRGLCFRDSQQKSATLVYRAGTKHGPSLELKDKRIDKGNFNDEMIYEMSQMSHILNCGCDVKCSIVCKLSFFLFVKFVIRNLKFVIL